MWKEYGMSALSSMTSNLINLPFNMMYMQEAQRHDLEKMDKQYEMNRQAYDYQLSQTSPIAQVQRYEDAGLNKALMYGTSGGGLSASFGSSSISNSPRSSASSSFNVSPMEIAYKENMMQNQTRITNAQARKAEAEADLAESQSAKNYTEIDIMDYRYEHILPLERDLYESRKEMISEQGKKFLSERLYNDFQRAVKSLRNLDEIKLIWAQTSEALSRAHLNGADARLAQHQVDKLYAEIAGINADIALKEAYGEHEWYKIKETILKSSNIELQKDLIIEQARLVAAQAGIAEFDAQTARERLDFNKKIETSSEIRRWIGTILGIIPLSSSGNYGDKKSSKSSSGSYGDDSYGGSFSPYVFAD